jgi:alpha-L-rhamnosidase
MKPPFFPLRNLRCDYLQNPLGIDTLIPGLSWEIKMDVLPGVSQKFYRITVASSVILLEKGQADLWDSGRVESNQSIHVAYAGRPLTSRQRCYWTVTVEIEGGTSLTSALASWSMGLLNSTDWQAQWIGVDQTTEYPEPWFGAAEWIWSGEGQAEKKYAAGAHWFCCEFEVPAALADAPISLWAYGDDECAIYFNDQSVARATPVMICSTPYPFLCVYPPPRHQRIASGLPDGRHRLALRAVNTEGGERPAGVVLRLQLQKNGLSHEVVTNATWQHFVEKEVLSISPSNDSSALWKNAFSLGTFGLPPWDQVNVREFRNLSARFLRQEIELPEEFGPATIYISGLGHFELYVNGQRVGDEMLVPNITDYEKRVFYRTYDIRPYLRPGKNALGVVLGNGWFFAARDRMPFPWKSFGCPKMILQLEVETCDSTILTFVSDATWKISVEGPLGWNNLFDGEIYDAWKEMPGWNEIGFADQDWQPVQMVARPGGILSAPMAEPQRVTETLVPIDSF